MQENSLEIHALNMLQGNISVQEKKKIMDIMKDLESIQTVL